MELLCLNGYNLENVSKRTIKYYSLSGSSYQSSSEFTANL